MTSPGIIYVLFTHNTPEDYAIECILKFVSKEVDSASGEPEEEGYEDEYLLDEVEFASGSD